MFCSQCGSEIAPGVTFCGACGASVDGSGAAPGQFAPQGQMMPSMTRAPLGVVSQAPSQGQAPAAKASKAVDPQAVAAYQQAKTQYKAAKKAAGKTNTPFAIAAVVALAVVAGAAAGGTWFAMQQQINDLNAQLEGVQGQLDASATALDAQVQETERAEAVAAAAEQQQSSQSTQDTSEFDASSDDADQAAAPQASPYAQWIGTWTGAVTTVDSNGQYKCYGAETQELVLTISDISSAGRVTASVQVISHSHSVDDLTADAATVAGDQYVTLDGLTSSFGGDGFSLSATTPEGTEISIDVSPEPGATSQLGAEVECKPKDSWSRTYDTYVLTKTATA